MPRWKDDPRGPYIRMHSGQKFYLKTPRDNEISIPDLAYHLAGINRYTGGSRYTVAQHCVVAAQMAQRFYPDQRYLPAKMLIHDAAEAYYSDMSSPLKALNPDYRALLQEADLAIETKFDLTFLDDPMFKVVDERMWLTERLVVYPTKPADFGEDVEGVTNEPFELNAEELHHYFGAWGAREAEEEWLLHRHSLLPWVRW